MQYQDFMHSLKQDACPDGLESCLRALWFDARGDRDAAHDIVQEAGDALAMRVHAYLHRKEGDDWNSRYWHRRAGSEFPAGMSLQAEWDMLVRELVDQGKEGPE